MRPWLGLLVAYLASPGFLAAQAPSLRAEIDTTVVTVGDRITLQVSVEHRTESRVEWPDSLDLGPFEILEARVDPPRINGDTTLSSLTLTVAAFEVGDLEIPSFEVVVVGPEGESTNLGSDRFGVSVRSVGLDEGGDIRDLKGPMRIPRGIGQILLLALWALLAAGFWWLVVRAVRRRRNRTQGWTPPKPPRPAHELALEALARLERSPLLERGKVKEFHIQASEILRLYVEDRFGVPALEMTTTDITEGLQKAEIDPKVVDGFESFLHQCDMVKFAKYRPSSEASRDVLALGRRLVESTIPVLVDDPEAAPPGNETPDQVSVEKEPEEASV